MSTNVTCDAVQDTLVTGALGDLDHQHITGCATCKGWIQMTESIGTELSEVPAVAGQRPQWIAELHARSARRRKRVVWGSVALGLATSAALAILLLRPSTQTTPDESEQPSAIPAPVAPDTYTTQPTALRPQNVPPSLLEGVRVAGEKNIVPDDATKTEISRSGIDRIIGSFKLCISPAGAVTHVAQLKSTGFAAYDSKIVDTIRTQWRYKPYMVNNEAIPVCTAVTFIYTQK
jgi:hypothetical protein